MYPITAYLAIIIRRWVVVVVRGWGIRRRCL